MGWQFLETQFLFCACWQYGESLSLVVTKRPTELTDTRCTYGSEHSRVIASARTYLQEACNCPCDQVSCAAHARRCERHNHSGHSEGPECTLHRPFLCLQIEHTTCAIATCRKLAGSIARQMGGEHGGAMLATSSEIQCWLDKPYLKFCGCGLL